MLMSYSHGSRAQPLEVSSRRLTDSLNLVNCPVETVRECEAFWIIFPAGPLISNTSINDSDDELIHFVNAEDTRTAVGLWRIDSSPSWRPKFPLGLSSGQVGSAQNSVRFRKEVGALKWNT